MDSGRLVLLGIAMVFVGFALVAAGALVGPSGPSSSGGFILIGPIPIVVGSGPNSGTLATVGLVITAAMVAVYLISLLLWRSGKRREAGAGTLGSSWLMPTGRWSLCRPKRPLSPQAPAPRPALRRPRRSSLARPRARSRRSLC